MAINMMDIVNKNGDKIDTKSILKKNLALRYAKYPPLKAMAYWRPLKRLSRLPLQEKRQFPYIHLTDAWSMLSLTSRKPFFIHFPRNSRDGTRLKYLSVTRAFSPSLTSRLTLLNILKAISLPARRNGR